MRKILPHTFRGWAGLGLVVVLALAGFALLLLYSTPHWYAPLDPHNQQVIDAAEHVQYTALDLHNKLEELPDGQREWSITQNEINAYLAVHTHDAESPAIFRRGTVCDPMVILRPGEIAVAARVAEMPGGAAGGVVTVAVRVAALPPDATGQTPLQVTLHSVTLGSLPIPSSLVRERIPQLMGPVAQAVSGVLDPAVVQCLLAGQPVPVPIKYRKRQVNIKDVRIETGKLTVVLSL